MMRPKNLSVIVYPLILCIILGGCETGKKNAKEEPGTLSGGYYIEPVNIQQVKLTDDFWLPVIKRVQEKTIEYALSY